ncbi:PhoX family protein [Rhodopirellula sp. JC740]|uniref:PhoX family protein n=1 Tax=Rhodopirellula halodulae TaxID=2894198 RepID=A0ABS8NJW1_9BACT|nr:alkaline phosphatase PhoX [Rhodopirellula sp. JC740]MCC9643853.1 PhoX family protein [Rhodopirellula sp. JC740]
MDVLSWGWFSTVTDRNRRQFLSDNFSALGSFGVTAAIAGLGQRVASGGQHQKGPVLRPMSDESTGLPLLRLPEGFRYRTFGWSGDIMDDGTPTPVAHDGMGVIAAEGDVLTLVRNHEISDDGRAIAIKSGNAYDGHARAGCTELKFDSAKGEWLSSRVVFSGSSRNCAGGVTPWGTWLTAEETVLGPRDADHYKEDKVRTFEKTHGWVFEVGHTDSDGNPVPIRDMGRFVHEAIAVDRNSGVVYLTEDRGTSGFYRFLPKTPGKLHEGGVLEMAEVVGQPDLRGGFKNGVEFDVVWHKIDDPSRAHSPESLSKRTSEHEMGDELGVYLQGKAKGGSTFSRLEGCWFGNGVVYFDATSGGAAQAGQIWQFDPEQQKLKLLFESPSKPTLNMPDNLCVSPQGGLVLCEDNDYGANEYPQRAFTLSQDGNLKLLAENNVQLHGEKNGWKGDFRTKEWAGATFSPDGKWLFINLQSPGITCAITGPWKDAFA